jgi:hypothetical protein
MNELSLFIMAEFSACDRGTNRPTMDATRASLNGLTDSKASHFKGHVNIYSGMAQIHIIGSYRLHPGTKKALVL